MANDIPFRSKENDIIAKTETDFFVVDHDFDPYSGDVSNFIAVAEHTKSNSQNTELDFLEILLLSSYQKMFTRIMKN